jgi:uncharacterized protein YndB with AHSA1/START domain
MGGDGVRAPRAIRGPMTDLRETGRTKDAGWEIGVRRTVPARVDDVWALLRSPEGTAIWLGGPADLAPGPYRLDDGTEGEVRADAPGSHIRLTWRPPGAAAPSTIQVRVTEAASGATIAFHHERLADADERERMRRRWVDVIDRLRERLPAS